MKATKDKYIIFEPWWGGFSNIRMTYELIGAISEITGRTIILPERIYCLFLAQWWDKETWIDMFSLLDYEKYTSTFKCIDYDGTEVTQYDNKKDHLWGVHKRDDVEVVLFGDKLERLKAQRGPVDQNCVIYNDIDDEEDFNLFKQKRDVLVNVNSDKKYLYFPRNLFGHFNYHVYGNGPIERNRIKEKVNKGIQYRKEFFDIADKVCNHLNNDFNAIHIRRNDFLNVRKHESENQFTNLLKDIEDRIPKDKPLFIATDESKREIFQFLKQAGYTYYFAGDFYPYMAHLIKDTHPDVSEEICALLVDQIVCSKADIFLGSFLSTFSDYINILRGQNNLKDFHREGTNFNRPKLIYERFPWEVEDYSWDKTWSDHWTYERSYFNLGIHGSHNAALAISYKGEVLEVVELEKWIEQKNAALWFYYPNGEPIDKIKEILEYFKTKYGAYKYDNIAYQSVPNNVIESLPAFEYKHILHHEAHVWNSYYQSPAKKTLNISFDGGSDNGHFNIYKVEDKILTHLHRSNQDLGVPYSAVAHYLSAIKHEKDLPKGNLTHAGKIMGLSAYGEYDEDYYNKIKKVYLKQTNDNINEAHVNFQKIFEIGPNRKFNKRESYNLAYNNQKVFEDLFDEIVKPYIEEYKDYELHFSGGGAMNIINNRRYNAFVSPNPDDRGLALGCVLSIIQPDRVLDSTYLGSLPYDKHPKYSKITIKEVVKALKDEKIIGIIRGRLEMGARALGNRSIICLPKKGMKAKLNKEVKHREPFRPFAPICRLEDADKWFKFGKHTRWMTHNAEVINKIEEIEDIIHNDGTARLQTVTREQNSYIYDILTEMDNQGLVPVIINTSFNRMGEPILNRYSTALKVRNETGLDMIITDKGVLH